jgi:hypothetical protein
MIKIWCKVWQKEFDETDNCIISPCCGTCVESEEDDGEEDE